MDTPGSPGQGCVTVLVVDDEDMVREYMARILSDAGYTVLVAHDGLEAWEVIEQRAGAFQFVITDITMPGLDGPDLAARIRQRWPSLPILYVSGRVLPADAPAAPLLEKPFMPNVLTAHVQGALISQEVV